MSNTKGVTRAQAMAAVHTFWDQLYKLLSDTEETKTSAPEIAKILDTTHYEASNSVRLLRGLGVITYRSHYDKAAQSVYFKRLMSLPAGHEALQAHFDKGRGVNYYRGPGRSELQGRIVTSNTDPEGHNFKPWRKPRPVADPSRGRSLGKEDRVETREQVAVTGGVAVDETVAIVGPDAEQPMETALRSTRREISEPAALMEAARQYIDRERAVVAKVTELESLGITIDHSQLKKAIKLDRDPVLEQVALLLPEWDAMTNRVTRLGRENADLRDDVRTARKKLSDADEAVRKLSEANQRLSQRNVSLSGELAQKRETQQQASA